MNITNKIIMIILFLAVSCGKEVLSDQAIEFEKAKTDLNNKNYFKANERLRTLSLRYPNNLNYKKLLADSYLGIGGFELIDFLVNLEKVVESSFSEQKFLIEVRKFTDKYILFTQDRLSNISKALVLYNQIGDFEVDSRESFLKKGLIQSFLFTQSLKDFVLKIQKQTNLPTLNRFEDYVKVLNLYKAEFDGIVEHSFKAYINFKESFDQIEDLLFEVDRAIFRLLGKPYNSIKDELDNITLEGFIEILVKYNPDIYELLMKRVFETCERGDALEKLRSILADVRSEESGRYLFLEKTIMGLINYVKRHESTICNMDYQLI